MKYNWPAVVQTFRQFVLANVKVYAKVGDKKVSPGFTEYLAIQMLQTDTFHPFGSDGELSRALDHHPLRCDYRSIQSYNATMDSRDRIEGALYEMLNEVQDLIMDHFNNTYEFAPNTILPESIVFPTDWDDVVAKLRSKVVAAAKKQ